MFSRKRHFYEKKTFYAALFTAFTVVLSASLWFNGDIGSNPRKDPSGTVLEDPVTHLDQQRDEQVSSEVNSGQAGISGAEIIPRPESEGYFVVEEDRYIKIYQMEDGGEMKLVRTSEILFDLLSSEDQEMFRLGVMLENEEQLMELLQDFES